MHLDIFFIIIPLIALIMGVVLTKNTFYAFWPPVIAMLGGLGLGIALLALIANKVDSPAQWASYTAFRDTVAEMRARNPESVENAAIQVQIAKWNQSIAKQQYWNRTFPTFAIPSADRMEPIK